MEMELEITFEELQPVIDETRVEGIMLYGKATLASSREDGSDEFYVKSISLEQSPGKMFHLKEPQYRHLASDFHGKLFNAIAAEIENEKTSTGRFAQAKFSEAVRDAMEA